MTNTMEVGGEASISAPICHHPGARWWSFDFHTHTPASLDTTAWQFAIGTADEVTPEKWLLRYMAAEIDCVAITDHNTGAWVDKLKQAYGEMQQSKPAGFRELHLFPAVEISVNGGFHLLAIFDLGATAQDIDRLLGAVSYEDSPGDSDGVTKKSAVEVVQAVLAAGAIPIPAHALNGKGLLELKEGSASQARIDSQTLEQVLHIAGILAMEVVDTAVTKPQIYLQKKLRWAEVVGSDCHSFQGPAIPGSRYTWVKMERPSLDGLRLALLDGQEFSIRRSDDTPPFQPLSTPEHFIEEITIGQARAMGRKTPAVMSFNPWLNAIVGGRGTGKSTIVHALRLAYRRDEELIAKTEAGETFTRFKQISKSRNEVGGLLPETRLSVTLMRDNIRHRLHWSVNGEGGSVEEWDSAKNAWQASPSQLITPQRFPLRMFSQGQIAALAGDSQQALLQVIDDAADAAQAKSRLQEAKQAFSTVQSQLRQLQGKLAGREALALSLQDVQRKLQRFEVTEHAKILQNYQRNTRQQRELARQFEVAKEWQQRLLDLAQEMALEDVPMDLFAVDADGEALQSLAKLAELIKQAKTAVADAARNLAEGLVQEQDAFQASPWQQQSAHIKQAFDALKLDLAAQGISDPNEYGRLAQERQCLEVEMKQMEVLQTQLAQLKETAKLQREEIWQQRRAVSVRRQEFLQQTLVANDFVRIQLRAFAQNGDGIERGLRELLNIGDKFKDDIDAIRLIFDLDDAVTLEKQIEALQLRLYNACKGKGDFGAKFNNYLSTEAQKNPSLIDQILCWFPEDGLQVEYSRQGNGENFEPILQASAGQRAAAMLAFLLSHGTEPLVLDQPEDDLDNHLIYDLVVQQIRANKQRRQLIIVTHNPNIVVNGDAELIHVLDFNHQCFIKKSGALQDREIRNEICQIMEGGKDAFERRYRRLGREAG